MTPPFELRLGRWQEQLVDLEEFHSCITDVPYSARTVDGTRSLGPRKGAGVKQQVVADTIRYDAWTEEDAAELAAFVIPRTLRWFVTTCDHVVWAWLEELFMGAGWITAHPIPYMKSDGAPRMDGTGPSMTTEAVFIARPPTGKHLVRRHRRGHYLGESRSGRVGIVVGGKPAWLCEALVRDYSEAGDTLVDPFAGGASFLLAAAVEGRYAVGCEQDPETFAKAQARLSQGFTPRMFGVRSKKKPKTPDMFK